MAHEAPESKSMKYVGTLQMARLLDAREFYEQHGYKFVDAPWTVGREAILMTRPPWITGEPFSYAAGGVFQYPVASAEQSFIQMQMDAIAAGKPITGSYCAITPCFRNESILDDLHQPYFMKLELITWDAWEGSATDMSRMIQLAKIWFESEHPGDHPGDDLMTSIVPNNDADPLGVTQAYDIQTSRTRIELGSYGIREHMKVGRWAYGTGLAEPRYSHALEAEKTYKSAAGRPS
jgi:hypothetical protein